MAANSSGETTVVVTVLEDLNAFFKQHVLESVNGSIQIFQSMTYGEMAIVLLLSIMIGLYVLKWFFEVVR